MGALSRVGTLSWDNGMITTTDLGHGKPPLHLLLRLYICMRALWEVTTQEITLSVDHEWINWAIFKYTKLHHTICNFSTLRSFLQAVQHCTDTLFTKRTIEDCSDHKNLHYIEQCALFSSMTISVAFLLRLSFSALLSSFMSFHRSFSVYTLSNTHS